MKKKFRYATRPIMVVVFLYIFLNLTANSFFRGNERNWRKNDDVKTNGTPALAKNLIRNKTNKDRITERKIISASGGMIKIDKLILEIPEFAIKSKKEISITPLRYQDLPPLDQNLINVTQNKGGYRFLPHGSVFEKEVKIYFPYDENLIPKGYSQEDIMTYFFDEKINHWVALKRDHVETTSGRVVSLTGHFTDMINGIIKVPESPQSHNYLPTTFKDMRAADPSKGIDIIDPPEASSSGNAALRYPLTIPEGRQGMQPDLAINYNNDAKNGWLGVGWNLMIPSISIDTRWGAPRYSNEKETETYLLGSEQLSPVAHRGDPVDRTSEKQFFPRVENDFKKIIRHGDNPLNYWWEVTEKNGSRCFYGGRPGSGVDASSVLTDASGNIAYWAMTEERDLNDNFIHYNYKKVVDFGVAGGVVPGYQLYPDKITYTGHGNQEGKYSITFKTDRDLNESKRNDIIINARLGFKQVTADRLRKIEIQFNNNPVRKYELRYHEGAFYKTLLDDVIEFDASGNEFYRHHFDYYDDIRTQGAYHPFQTQQNWQSPGDDIHGDFINRIQNFGDDISALGGNKSFGGGGGLTVTAGPFDGRLFNKSFTAGASFGFSKSKNEGLLQLVDINGDELPDKVFKKNGALFFRPNESGPDGQLKFGSLRPISGITDFDKGTATTIEGGIESNFVIYAGLQFSQTKNERSVYFADVNGDMLMDIVKDGVVFFNHLDASGNPVFTTSSSPTPSPIHTSGGVDQSLVSIDSTELHQLEEDNPLHDVVKVWKAPYDGIIKIVAPVQLAEDTSADRQSYQSADGVRVAIQQNGTELWYLLISENDYAQKFPAGLDSINVLKGDQFYFRVQSIYDGAYDQVKWMPVITYRNHVPGLNDANDFPVFEFNAFSDFLATAPMSVGMTFNGVVQVSGSFQKPQTSDDIEVEVVKKVSGVENIIWHQQFAWDSLVTDSINFTNTVAKADELYFKVRSGTNIDWQTINWSPRVYYISSNDTAVTNVFDDNGNPLFDFYPVVDFSIYNKIIHPSLPWIAYRNDTLSILPGLQMSSSNNQSGSVIFSIKKKNELVKKETITITPPANITGGDTLKVMVNTGDSLYIEYHTRNDTLWNFLTSHSAKIFGRDTTITFTPGTQIFTEEKHQFGAMFRHWGQFGYRGNGNLGLNAINESFLVLPHSIASPDSIDLSNAGGNEDSIQNMYNNHNGNLPRKDTFIYMVPSARERSWNGYDDLTYVTHDIISASRMGEDDLIPINPLGGSPGGGTGAKAIKKLSRTRNVSVSAGFVINGSYSRGNTVQLYDYTDMNGDSYPDLLSKNMIQYTLPIGGLDAHAKNFVFGEVDQSNHYALGIAAGGTFLTSGAFNTKSKNRGMKSSDAGKEASITASLTGSISVNHDSTSFSWFDINGDGLPDRVHKNGDVELNLGYSFAPTEHWSFTGISEGNALSFSGGLGINIGNHSIAVGVSFSRTENNLNKALRDVNGDGLPDYIVDHPRELIPNSDPLMVAFNTGNGFANPIAWTGAFAISEDVSTGVSANGAFCACIPITPLTPVAKICFNPSGEVSSGVNHEKVTLLDINGDDYPDFLESHGDDDLKIMLSTIGKTNLLRSVTRPMGANFVLDYKRIGNSYGMPSTTWVLDRVKLFDGVIGDGADTSFTTFEYVDGFYDRNEREFYGFKTVKTHEHDTKNGNMVYRTTVQEFINDNYYEKGLMLSKVLLDSAGKKFNETVNKYQLKNVHNGSTLPPGFETSDSGEAFPALTETKTLFYEGQSSAAKSTRITYAYDVVGNIVSYTDFGDTDPSDDNTTQISYYSIADKYIMSTPKSVLVTGGGQIFRKKEQDIVAQTGDITEIRIYSEPGVTSIYNMEYDEFGNLKTITRPKNENNQRLKYTYQYDPDVNTYVAKVSDSYGYFSTLTYDPRFGKLLTLTDINNQKTIYTIDAAGRDLTITAPKESAAGIPFTIAFQYHHDAVVPWALTKHYDPEHPNNFIETVVFMDGLMRPIQYKKDGALFTSPNGNDHEVMLVSGADIYDAFGRKTETYYPITEEKGNEGVYNKLRDIIAPTKISFDVLDREINRIQPDGITSTIKFAFAADRDGVTQFSNLVTDGNGIKKENFTDVRGRITAVKNYFSQQQDIWTSFKYNAINELINVKDNEQNIITTEYDWQGRKIKLSHPDAGLTTYQYNPASKLVKKVTANLQGTSKAIVYKYDQERLLQIVYPENPLNNVKYTYGTMGSSYNRAGRITVQEDATGAQEFFYDQLGNIIKNIRSVIVPLKGVFTYKTEWTFDTWNRVQTMIYPDGEILQYDYNLGGLLVSMSGQKENTSAIYLAQMGYDKFEQKLYMRYGNGTETFYNYEPQRRRLHQMIAETAMNRKIMNTIYTYDKERNIVDLNNEADIPPSNLMGGSSMYHFNYDDLYRITRATGNFKGSTHEQRFDITMSYSSVGNIVQKTQAHDKRANNSQNWVSQGETTYSLSYEYTSNKPHAPVKIGKKNYVYDANGNQKGWAQNPGGQQRTIKWDEENRVNSITDNGALFSYTYDADGERVLKNNGGNAQVKINGEVAGGSTGIGNYTIYVNPYLVVTSGNYTKHYYAEESRLASKLDESKNLVPLNINAGQSANANINYNLKEENTKKAILKQYNDPDVDLSFTEKNSINGKKEIIKDFDIANNTTGQTPAGGNGGNQKNVIYFYHPDHVGNTAYVTDASGEVFQHLEYFPFGETFVEEKSNTQRTPYLYNAKELDEETGLYYYGARYYDARTQVWQSTDPKKEEYPSWSPYDYTHQSPVNYSDPDGKELDEVCKALLAPRDNKGKNYTYIAVAKDYFDGFTKNISYTFESKTYRIYWSGGPQAMEDARKYAEANDAITLEMTFEGARLEALSNVRNKLAENERGRNTAVIGRKVKIINPKTGEEIKPNEFESFQITENFWSQLSAGYAKGVKIAAVFRRRILRVGNIWEGKEKPRLDIQNIHATEHFID